MLRIGVVNIDVSHPGAFAQILLEGDRARYVAVYNDGFRGADEVAGFAKKAQLEKICASVEELAEFVDVGFIQGCNWDKHIAYAKPFIDRGKPVFLDKPIVGNLRDCRTLQELVNSGATIIGSSSVRYCKEIRAFLDLPEAERGKVLHVTMTVGADEFNYAIHALEGVCALVEARPKTVRYVGGTCRDGQKCETYFVEFENGATATYHCQEPNFVSFHTVVMTTTRNMAFTIDSSQLYGAMLEQICNYFEGKAHILANIEQLTDSIQVALAGKCSKENGGTAVAIDSKALETVSFDGYAFEKGYAAAAKPMYL